MLATQRKLGFLIVIKDDFLPASGVMTLLTFFTLATFVVVIDFVAAETLFRCILKLIVFVAGTATDISMLVRQIKLCVFVLEINFIPIFCGMT